METPFDPKEDMMAKKKMTGSSTKSIEQAIENALGFGPLEARSGPDPDKGETFRLTKTTVEVGTVSGGHTYEVTLKSP